MRVTQGPIAKIETQNQLHLHFDASANPLHDADEDLSFFPERHEIDDFRGPVRRFELCFEDERVAQVLSRDRCVRTRGADQPTSVLGRAQQSGETRRRIKSWQAQQSIDPSLPREPQSRSRQSSRSLQCGMASRFGLPIGLATSLECRGVKANILRGVGLPGTSCSFPAVYSAG